jgi:hypothetical protein
VVAQFTNASHRPQRGEERTRRMDVDIPVNIYLKEKVRIVGVGLPRNGRFVAVYITTMPSQNLKSKKVLKD